MGGGAWARGKLPLPNSAWEGAPRLSHHKIGVHCCSTPSSLSKDSTHMASAAPFASALYSASVLDLETVGCFFELQEIKFGPTKMAKPPVARRSSTHPSQSASVKILMPVDGDFRKCSLVSIVPFTYRKMRFTASQCTSIGCERN